MNASAAYQNIVRVVLLLIVGTVLVLTPVAVAGGVSFHASPSTLNLAGHCSTCN